MKKNKVGRPRTGKKRSRNQFNLKMNVKTLILLDEKSDDESYSQTVSELVMRNMIASGFYIPPIDKPESVQITVSDEVMKHVDKICKQNKMNPTQVIMHFLKQELEKN